MAQIPDYYRAFDPAAEFSNGLGSFRCATREIAVLSVPDGRIVAGDPLVELSRDPFSTAVPSGEYPVLIAIARLDSGGMVDERIACAMVRFSDATPERWVMATTASQEPGELNEGEIFGYGVDSGMGCFASAAAARALQRRLAADDSYYDRITNEAEKVYRSTRDWASVVPDPAGGPNIVTFSSGLGDGFYASYWGHARDGRPVCLITDFGLVEPDTAEPPGIVRRLVQRFRGWRGG